MSGQVPKCGIVIPVKIGSDEWCGRKTGEFKFSSGVYRYIDQSADASEDVWDTIDPSDVPTEEIPTDNLGLGEDDARQVDEFMVGLDESSSTLKENTAPEWFIRD